MSREIADNLFVVRCLDDVAKPYVLTTAVPHDGTCDIVEVARLATYQDVLNFKREWIMSDDEFDFHNQPKDDGLPWEA